MNQETAQITKIAIFRNRRIRKTIYKNEWWFAITDVIAALTDSQNPKQYLKNMLNRDEELARGWVQIEHPLLIETSGGKQKVRCANTEGIFRIIQSIPSPKAEPFKRWLARVGYERVHEIEDPELAITTLSFPRAASKKLVPLGGKRESSNTNYEQNLLRLYIS